MNVNPTKSEEHFKNVLKVHTSLTLPVFTVTLSVWPPVASASSFYVPLSSADPVSPAMIYSESATSSDGIYYAVLFLFIRECRDCSRPDGGVTGVASNCDNSFCCGQFTNCSHV